VLMFLAAIGFVFLLVLKTYLSGRMETLSSILLPVLIGFLFSYSMRLAGPFPKEPAIIAGIVIAGASYLATRLAMNLIKDKLSAISTEQSAKRQMK